MHNDCPYCKIFYYISLVSMIPIKFIRIWKKHFAKYDPVPMSEHKAVIKCKSNLKIDNEDYPVM